MKKKLYKIFYAGVRFELVIIFDLIIFFRCELCYNFLVSNTNLIRTKILF